MRTLTKLSLVALLAVGASRTLAADQLILGKVLLIKEPQPSPQSRVVKVIGRELTSPNTIVGDPTVGGVTARVVAHGVTDTDVTYPLPAAGWLASSAGYKYTDPNGTYGPVRAASIKKMPAGVFLVKVVILGSLGVVNTEPPDPGTDGGLVFAIGGGDRYCTNFGGAAQGQVLNNPPGGTKRRFKVKKPLNETACLSSPSGAFLDASAAPY